MSNRTVLLFVAAIFMAGLTAFVVRQSMPSPPVEQVTAPQGSRVLIAKRDLGQGSFANVQTDFDFAPLPAENIREFHLQEGRFNVTDYQGAIIRRAVKSGEPLSDGMMVKRGSGGFMSAVLESGKRAVSIAVSATSGNAGFVLPGDFVDLILTHRVRVEDAGAASATDSVISETFVENVRVIAVDQMLDNPENKAVLAKTITVEVTPKQAEKINVAQDLGKISLSLRSLAADVATSQTAPADASSAENGGETAKEGLTSEAVDPFFMETVPAPPAAKAVTSDRDLSSALSSDSEVSPRVRVIRGGEVQTLRFYREQP